MSNVILLYGNDEFAIARRMNEFAADFPDPTSAGMNTARLDARTAGEDELNNAVNAMPFLSPRRLVLLANPSGRYTHPSQRAKFTEFLEKVPETARLVIFESLDARDASRHWLVKWAQKAGAKAESFMMPRSWEMAGWIANETKTQGGKIDPRAAGQLAEMVGENTRQAAQEIGKLLAYVNFSRPVMPEDVQAVSIVTVQQSVFDFVDALAAGDGKKAMHLLKRLLEEDDAFSLWGMVIRQFRLLILAREVLDARGTLKDAETALGVHAFVAEKAYKQAQRFDMPTLEVIYHKLLEIDEGAKNGQMALDLALDRLVAELAGR